MAHVHHVHFSKETTVLISFPLDRRCGFVWIFISGNSGIRWPLLESVVVSFSSPPPPSLLGSGSNAHHAASSSYGGAPNTYAASTQRERERGRERERQKKVKCCGKIMNHKQAETHAKRKGTISSLAVSVANKLALFTDFRFRYTSNRVAFHFSIKTIFCVIHTP